MTSEAYHRLVPFEQVQAEAEPATLEELAR